MDSRTALLNAPRERRRLVALALPAIMALAVAALAFGVRTSLEARAAVLEDRRVELAQLQRLLSLARSTAGAPDPHTGPEFLLGGNPALAQAGFQRRLREIAATSGAELHSAENLPLVEQDGATFAGLSASLTGSNEALLEAIFQIESAEPYLTIRAARLSVAEPGPAAGEGPQQLSLQVRFEGALAPAAAARGEAE